MALDLRGALTAAEATLRSALARCESRGAHQRTDFPEIDPAQEVNLRVGRDAEGRQHVRSVAVPPVPDELRAVVDDDPELALQGRLLE